MVARRSTNVLRSLHMKLTAVRIEESEIKRAKKAAKNIGLNFSSYIRHLIAKDLNQIAAAKQEAAK